VKVLLRRQEAGRRPLLYQASPPYEKWTAREVPIALHGPSMWELAGRTYIGGRWFPNDQPPLTAIFTLDVNAPKLTTELVTVLPSGPGFDHSYIGPAIDPNDPHRLRLSYYSPHGGTPDHGTAQSLKTDIYLVDATVQTPG
jgi:hypothetical protein